MMGVGRGGGWKLGESAALELDLALSFACQAAPPKGRGEVLEELWALLPAEARREYRELLGEARPFRSSLEVLAILSGVLGEADYAKASLAMRGLDPQGALAAIFARAPGLAPQRPPAAGEAASLLLELYPAFLATAYSEAGLEAAAIEGSLIQARRDMARALTIMGGGSAHEGFWHWLDRFYYGSYQAWRRGFDLAIEESREEALRALGSPSASSGAMPPLDWLPAENPLRTRPELALALEGGLEVLFCLEPFGMADVWLIEPGRLVVTTSRPGPLFEAFRQRMSDVAARASALADPSRLAILRMIRQVGVSNTDMAAWLHLSRPTVSVHARILREAGLIRSRQEGRITRHEIVPGQVARLFMDLAELLDLEPDLDFHPPKEIP